MAQVTFEETAVSFEEETNAAAEAPGSSLLDRLGGKLLVVLAFLVPVFFVPSPLLPFQFGKTLLVAFIVLAVFCVYLIARLKDGRFALPQSPLLISLGAIAVLFALSSLFSGAAASSFLGDGLEVGTTASLALLALLAFLIPVMFRSKEQVFGGYLAFLVSFALLALFHLLRLAFGPDFLSLGIFTSAAANTVGKWNDLGIFFGASALLFLITIEFLMLNRLFRALMYLALAVSLFFLALVNFLAVWTVLALFSLVFLVYLISFGREREAPRAGAAAERVIPVPSLLVLLVSVFFILGGAALGGGLAERFGISQIEARPSWQATFDVARRTLIADPLLGSGPNQFAYEWQKHRPDGVNQTIFWNTDFTNGVGLLPTFLATGGILGALAWVVFLLLFLYAGFSAILSENQDKFSQYLVASSFLVALFLWVWSVFYVPSPAIFALTFIFTGFFIAAQAAAGGIGVKQFSWNRDPRAGFVSVLLLILLLIGSVALGYALFGRALSASYFERGVRAYASEGSIEKAERLIGRAAELSPLDLYYRFLSEIALLRIQRLLGTPAGAASAESVRTEFQNLLSLALGNAQQAVASAPKNYQNFMQLGRIYEAVVPPPIGIAGAYESAKASYNEALARNPRSPAIYLTLARLEMAKRDNAAAREYIAQALREKGNYTEAIFLLSQLEAGEGNIKAAISSVEAASVIAPNDPGIFFQLGLLRWNDKDYRGAAGALERAVALNPAYANAKYFLGLAYERIGRDADALRQFADLQATNPDNKEIGLIVRNLKAGRAPFAEAAPPIDDKPEKRSKLPVSDEE